MFRSDTIIQPLSVKEDSSVLVTLDIGDTYSGFAYTYTKEYLEDEWTIHMNDPWVREKHMTHKTCTTLLLEPHGEMKGAKYGYEAETDFAGKFLDGCHAEYLLFRNVKQEFYKDGVNFDAMITDVNSGQEKPLCDILLALLTFFREKALERVRKRFDAITENDIFWVLSVPSAWKQETSLLYRDLAIESGIPFRRLRLVTEPEACLAYVMQFIRIKVSPDGRAKISNKISHFDARVMLLDLSGDAATLSVHRVSGDKTFKMVFQTRSHKKGSSQVNDQFLLFLSNLIGEDIIRTLKKDYIDDYMAMCDEFEMRKREIKPGTSGTELFSFKLPYQIEETFKEQYKTEYVTITQRIKEKSVYRDRVRYDGSRLHVEISVLKDLFNIVLDKIEVYIRNVLQMAPCARIASFMLVGGFSESKLVQAGIKKRFPEMEVIIPETPELAVMKGSVMLAMNHEIRPPTPVSGSYQKEKEQTIISSVCTVL
ncbi:heat shock 70 kDa protein 12A-like [Mercenaria mercenaria]|uniref:heat shock 70 kDa protein 12A-like n=1 Tax=Mercenaria mercenaria TaxID=6596 RepID=UPI00234EA6D2|nr:heat shock 70 kDa protein 12A-like [Mercenaria mercenaria]XP_045191552.2 heat shock 70 kDa protein 12A-like [Mercenaria mercenaria]